MAPPPLTRRQRDILAFIQQFIEEQGISPTFDEIARAFGLSRVTVFGHVGELERKGVVRRAARGHSRTLQIVPPEEQEWNQERAQVPTPAPVPQLPQLSILGTIAAGAPISTLEIPETLDFEDFTPPGKDVYVLRVQGNSMIEDSIRDGDLVVVEHRSSAHNGETVVAVLPEEEATLKRYYREADGRVRLQPANAEFQPVIVDEVEIRGVVIGVLRRY